MGGQEQAIDFIRKKPKQGRAKLTVDAILEATIQLLGEDDDSHLTTNHIAERAGISVGTLYQYFSNKDEILSVLLKTYRRELVEHINTELNRTNLDHPDQAISQIVHVLIQSFKSILAARSSMSQGLVMLPDERKAEHLSAVSDLIRVKIDSAADKSDTQLPLSEVRAFVLTRAVLGVIQNAMLTKPELLDDPEFEEQLIRLVSGFLK